MAGNSHRLAFLVVEVEPSQALSTRKLLLESAKHNVLTAHSGKEGIEMLKRFPHVDAITIDAGLRDMDCEDIARRMRQIRRKTPIVAMTPRVGGKCKWADHTISSYEPRQLLELLQELGGRSTI